MEAGELVGEIEILDPGQGRLASVVAEGPVRAIAVAQDDLRAALEAQPTAAWALLGVLAMHGSARQTRARAAPRARVCGSPDSSQRTGKNDSSSERSPRRR